MRAGFFIGVMTITLFSCGAIAEVTDISTSLIDQLMKAQAVKNGTPIAAETIVTVQPPAKSETTQPSANQASREDQQPVFKSAIKSNETNSKSSNSLWFRMFGSLGVVLLVIGGAYYGLKKWPVAQQLAQRSRMIEVLAQHPLGPKRSVAVIRVAGEAVLVGITDHNINILKSLALLDEDLPVPKNPQKKFRTSLASQIAKGESAPSSEPEEEFSMKGLKEIVGQRLKSLKEL